MSVDPPGLSELVATPESFELLARELARQAVIAVDTESNSLHAYRERVCLIQFSTVERDIVLDPLALDDLSPLAGIFANPDIEKVFHAAEYDLICLRRDYGFSFSRIFDTMHAGRILGSRLAGLDRLLEDEFGVKISKHFQKADWGVRPLSRELLLYAAVDTHYLIPLRDLLKSDLEARDLWQLAQEDFRRACDLAEPKPKSESPSWTRFTLRRDLTALELTILKELVACRDGIASRLDRPPFKVLDDDRLVEIARAQPVTTVELADLGLGARQLDHWGEDILNAVQVGSAAPLVERVPHKHPNGTYLKRLDKLKAWRKKAAAEMDVESDIVLPRDLLLALAEAGSNEMKSIMQDSPWRLQHFGDQISKVLQSVA
jgi:ribonuclease D